MSPPLGVNRDLAISSSTSGLVFFASAMKSLNSSLTVYTNLESPLSGTIPVGVPSSFTVPAYTAFLPEGTVSTMSAAK
jgi:hypothetical protein